MCGGLVNKSSSSLVGMVDFKDIKQSLAKSNNLVPSGITSQVIWIMTHVQVKPLFPHKILALNPQV